MAAKRKTYLKRIKTEKFPVSLDLQKQETFNSGWSPSIAVNYY